MRTVALIASYNERRFIEACLAHLERQGVDAYLIDNCSTDNTVELAERRLDRNLIGIESFPRGEGDVYDWRGLLRRKEELARTLEADWFMHLDPDEIRLPPAGGETLIQAFEAVDREGFNAVDFAEFTFVPTRERPDHDHPDFQRTMRAYYTFQTPRSPHQLKAWKAHPEAELASGGHRVRFPGQKVCPRQFRMKHYLALSVPHAVEKYAERRYDPDEVKAGWHGWRARVTAEKIELPSESELLVSRADDDLDPTAPRQTHFIDRQTSQPGPGAEAGAEVDSQRPERGATVRISRSEFPGRLRQRIDRGTPTAVIRFGDAEMQLLEADPDDAESMRIAIYKLKRETAGSFAYEDVLDVKANVSLAFDEADVLGILPDDNFSEKGKMWMAKLATHYAERRAKGRPAEALACCLLNYDIVDALPEMLAGRRVSVVSCRDLKPVLESGWGLDDVAVYQVPSQHAVRDIDGVYEGAMHDVPIWPNAHGRVRSELNVRERGEVFLVGAGAFGKDLCIRIRQLGGIAVDMGSALDRIAGKITRGPKRRALELHRGGMSVEQIAADFDRTYGVRVDRDRIAKALRTIHDGAPP